MANNPLELMKMFQNLQQNMAEMQKKLATVRVTGSAGGDLVTVDMDGQMQTLAVHISPEVIDPKEKEVLQDLIRAASVDAQSKIKDRLKDEFAGMSGLNLPPGVFGT